jgi:hypothetical protein
MCVGQGASWESGAGDSDKVTVPGSAVVTVLCQLQARLFSTTRLIIPDAWLTTLQGEESAPADVQATLEAMHAWSSGIDTPQLLQSMAQNDTAAVQQIHDKASSLVQQLEQQLGQVSEPVAVSWLKASAYDTYALLLRTTDWLNSTRDLHAAQRLADLVKVG